MGTKGGKKKAKSIPKKQMKATKGGLTLGGYSPVMRGNPGPWQSNPGPAQGNLTPPNALPGGD